jgi:hypothetical protein
MVKNALLVAIMALGIAVGAIAPSPTHTVAPKSVVAVSTDKPAQPADESPDCGPDLCWQ